MKSTRGRGKMGWWIAGGILVLFLAYPVSILLQMMFIGQITELKILFTAPHQDVAEGVTVVELPSDHPALPLQHKQQRSLAGQRAVLNGDGTFAIDPSEHGADERPVGNALALPGDKGTLVFAEGKVRRATGSLLEEPGKTFSAPAMEFVRHTAHIRDGLILVAGEAVDPSVAYTATHLWHFRYEDMSRAVLTATPYFMSSRPPMVLTPEGLNGALVIYYSESVSYGFGGDASRPAQSTVRLYSDIHANGLDLATFNFKAGTIVAATLESDSIVVMGDPSRPHAAQEEPRPPRYWQISLPRYPPQSSIRHNPQSQ